MLRILYCLLLISLLSNTSFGQTIEADYQYITQTFKVQLENDLGDKQGYHTSFDKKLVRGERTLELYRLHRIVNGHERIVAFAGIYQKGNNPKQYLCIPHPNSEEAMKDKFWRDVKANYAWSSSEEKVKLLFNAVSLCDWYGIY